MRPEKGERGAAGSLGGIGDGMKVVGPVSLSPTAQAASPNSGYFSGVRRARWETARALPAPPRLPRPARPLLRSDPSPKNQKPRGPRLGLQRTSQPFPLGTAAPAAQTLNRKSRTAAAGDPSPAPQLPRTKRAPPPHTHRGAPSRVPDADARPTLTAAAAAAEG